MAPKKTQTRPPLLARRTKRPPNRHAKGATSKPAPARPRTPLAPPSPVAHVELSSLEFARGTIRDIPDFPKPGIMFKDITPLLAVPEAFRFVIEAFAKEFGNRVDAIAAAE